MNAFAHAMETREVRTEKGMRAHANTGSKNLDFFAKVGAMRGQDVVPLFARAMVENQELALRIMLWSRDVRGGAGERQLFRDMLRHLENTLPDSTTLWKVMDKVPELGRWDDLLVMESPRAWAHIVKLVDNALYHKDGLCAKWMPRKGPIAERLRAGLGYTPRQYRKLLVELTKVVETQMCAGKWDEINFSHVPSKAAQQYKKAFLRNAPEQYKKYIDALVSGDPSVKVNASAIFPHDVFKDAIDPFSFYALKLRTLNYEEIVLINKQWEALPNYAETDLRILPIIDTSGSMLMATLPNSNVSALHVATGLGLYVSERNTGPFKDLVLPFSEKAVPMKEGGSILSRLASLLEMDWGGTTNFIGALDEVLRIGVQGRVPQSEMPEVLLILSDMQFDICTRYDDRALNAIRRRFEAAGYTPPTVVFWNINAKGNTPVTINDSGVVMVSGYSPSIMKSLLDIDVGNFTPEGIMLKTVMDDRYAL